MIVCVIPFLNIEIENHRKNKRFLFFYKKGKKIQQNLYIFFKKISKIVKKYATYEDGRFPRKKNLKKMYT